MSELVAFLLARIEDDEALVRSIDAPLPAVEGIVPVKLTAVDRAVALYIAPARVLAECAAKRKIVDLHKIHVEKDVERGRFNEETREFETCDYGYCTECDHDRDYGFIGSKAGLFGCPTLRLLALPFAGHPDYREEWKP